MGNMTLAFVFVVLLNVFFFLVQATVYEINPEGGLYYTYQGSLLQQYDVNNQQNNSLLKENTISEELPQDSADIGIGDQGNFFTDTFQSVKTWFGKKTAYVQQMLFGPYNILKSLGLPNQIVFAIGSLWYLICLIVIVSFFWGER